MNKKNEPLKMTYMRALESYKKKDYKNAETYCYKILSIDSYHFDSIFLLASIAGANKNYDQAKELLIKAVEIQPKNTTGIHNLGT